jgi:hypothetical protein
MLCLTGAERDDAANGVVGRNANRHAVARDDFDAETAHTAAELGEHFMPGVALNAIETSAVHCHDRPLHVNQIVFAQTSSESFQKAARYGLLLRACERRGSGNDCATNTP